MHHVPDIFINSQEKAPTMNDFSPLANPKTSKAAQWQRILALCAVLPLCVTISVGCSHENDALDDVSKPPTITPIHKGTVLVEVGHISPEIDVAMIEAERTVSVSFDIRGEIASFLDGTRHMDLLVPSGSMIALPPVSIGDAFGESSITVMIGDDTVVDEIKVASIPEGGVRELKTLMAEQADVIIYSEEHVAIVDDTTIMAGTKSFLPAPGEVATEPASATIPLDLCIRVPWGPGRVEWGFSSPSNAGYSVKPESAFNLIWAQAPGQDIDGIYKHSWGCGTALKVPDNCTATVQSNGSISCCCNALTSVKYVCSWVNPGSIGFPTCPL